MDIILWIVFGAIAAWIASLIMRSSQGMMGDAINWSLRGDFIGRALRVNRV